MKYLQNDLCAILPNRHRYVEIIIDIKFLRKLCEIGHSNASIVKRIKVNRLAV